MLCHNCNKEFGTNKDYIRHIVLGEQAKTEQPDEVLASKTLTSGW